MNNRILAMLLAIIMVISMVPVNAFAAEHTHVDENGNGVCDVSGCSEHVHVANTAWSCDDNGHFHRCTISGCGEIVDASVPHNFDKYVTAGENKHDATCKDCGRVVKLDHVDADKDCKCDDCNRALAHDFEIIEAVAKTCTTDGIYKHAKCKVCGGLYTYDGATAITEAHIVDKAPQHKAYTQWLKDETGHWHMCQNEDLKCEEKLEFAAHTPSEWREYPSDKSQHFTQCTTCGYSLTKEAHEYKYTAKDYGTDTHKIECTECNKAASVQSCVDGDKDCKCDNCGALMAGVHAAGLEYIKKVEPKCEEDGVDSHYKCGICGTLFADNAGKRPVTIEVLTLKKLEHDYSTGWVKDETGHWRYCKRTGCDGKVDFAAHTPGECRVYPSDTSKHFQLCTVCNQSTNIEAHEYKYEAKAYGAGTHAVICDDCGFTSAQTCVDGDGNCYCDLCNALLGHARAGLTYHAYKAATCIADGHHGYMTCNTCGNTFKNEKDANGFYIPGTDFVIETLGHNWGTIGETLNGKHQQQCTRCNLFRAVPHADENGDCVCDVAGCGIIVHSHNLMVIDAKAPTCTEPGTASYLKYEGCGKMFDLDRKPISAPAEIPSLGHDWSGAWEAYDADNHAKECQRCDEMQIEEHEDANEDNYCDVCEAPLALTYVAQQDPTCTNIGYKAYWVSEITGRKYADEAGSVLISNPEQIPALNHDMQVPESNGANGHTSKCSRCTYALYGAHVNANKDCFCDDCGQVLNGHKIAVGEGIVPTCTKAGVEDYYLCTCGQFYNLNGEPITAPIEMAPLGHKWQNKWYNDNREGAHSKDCMREGCYEKITEAHNLTCEDTYSGNLHEWSCSECSYQKSGVHKDSNGDTICDECGYDNDVTVDAGELDNPRETIKIKGDKDDTAEEKKSTWWNSFVGKLNPSYVGESESSSAPSASVETKVPNGSGTSSGSSGASQNAASAPATNPSTVGAVLDFLWDLLSSIFSF